MRTASAFVVVVVIVLNSCAVSRRMRFATSASPGPTICVVDNVHRINAHATIGDPSPHSLGCPAHPTGEPRACAGANPPTVAQTFVTGVMARRSAVYTSCLSVGLLQGLVLLTLVVVTVVTYVE